MFKYNVQIQKVSGRLNESVLPSKNLVVKSKSKKTDEEIFAEASKYFKDKYGLVIESAEILLEGGAFGAAGEQFNKCVELLKNWNGNKGVSVIEYDPATGKASQPSKGQVAISYGELGTVVISTQSGKLDIPKSECKFSTGNYNGLCVFIHHPTTKTVYIIKPLGNVR